MNLNFQSQEELKYQLALHFLPGIGPISARALLSYCGSVENIFLRKRSELEKIPGIGRERASLIHKKDLFLKAEEEISFMKKHEIKPLFCLDKDYPSRLKNCEDAPLMLFYKGNGSLNVKRMIAIVGTRFITPYGKSMTDKLIDNLREYGVTIVSGLAYGVDVHAHKGALRNDLPTIGVVAHGLDLLYPAENKPTAERMLNFGGLLSEYPGRTKPERENFPARNRIVAGMCDAVVVIESATKGGALITAELANDYNRDVFALPGRVSDHFSKGCHELIRKNKAMIYEDADHIAEMMGWKDEKSSDKKSLKQLDLFVSLNEEEKKLVDILRESGQSAIDAISLSSGMPVSKVSSALLNLEFAGVLRSLPGKIYELI